MEARGGALKAGSVPPEKGAKYSSRCRRDTLIRVGVVFEFSPDSYSPTLRWAYSYRRVL
jgi:hypothetical protein